MKAMEDWLEKPWCLVEKPDAKNAIFGYQAAMTTKNSADNWRRCWNILQPDEEVWCTGLHQRLTSAYGHQHLPIRYSEFGLANGFGRQGSIAM